MDYYYNKEEIAEGIQVAEAAIAHRGFALGVEE